MIKMINLAVICLLLFVTIFRIALTVSGKIPFSAASFLVLTLLIYVFIRKDDYAWIVGLFLSFVGIVYFGIYTLNSAEPTSIEFTSVLRSLIEPILGYNQNVVLVIFWFPLFFYTSMLVYLISPIGRRNYNVKKI